MASHISFQAISKFTASNHIKFSIILPSLQRGRRTWHRQQTSVHCKHLSKFLEKLGCQALLIISLLCAVSGRTELGGKTSKRILENNICSDGTIDNDKVARYYHELRDCIPCPTKHYQLHNDWIISAAQREQYYSKRNVDLKTEFE